MCNLYSLIRTQDAMRHLFKIDDDVAGNLPPMPGIYPDMMAPVIVHDGGRRRLQMMRWGFPPPPNVKSRPVTNIRNPASPFWKPWFESATRCLVPATSFCEWTDSTPKIANWFARGDEREMFAFAGVWRQWTGTRGSKAHPVTGEHQLFSFLTTAPNQLVRPIHAKAMPVILREDEWSTWLTAPRAHALRLQTPLPDGELKIVAIGVREDGGPATLQNAH